MQPTGEMILEGKVVGITKFGAFISLPDGSSGLVHISEIANTYVNDVHDHLEIGQAVQVVVLNIGENGKINLSIKKAQEPVVQPRPRPAMDRRQQFRQNDGSANLPADLSFEDKLKQFMHDSDNKMSGNRLYSDRKGASRKRRDR